jgi:hypothetical protein
MWVPLPGDDKHWPLDVRAGDQSLAVIAREGRPCAQLPVGRHTLTGQFHWDSMPQRIAIPQSIGLLSLEVGGQPVPIPNWDAQGQLWLQRHQSEVADQDLLTVQVYRVVVDGIPVWLRTQIELTVSGKSREEQLGWVLPLGWQLALVDSPIPVAVDPQGRMKAQVRAGKWTIHLSAFRTENAEEIRYPSDAEPIVDRELVGFQAKPTLRLAELEKIPAVDVTQTTFPAAWRNLPVYQWATDSPFRLVEKMRGMGDRRPEGLNITRQFWLDENGRGLTYADHISGRMQQIWRLDVADGQQLGAIRVDGKGQLITVDPARGAQGVEIRNRNLNLEAVGRIDRVRELSATGWQTDVDTLELTLMLPPGWRVLALLGPDQVEGDWLTAWSLLDLFLLLIFALAVGRQWGWLAGGVALLAFGLAYHEPGAPRLTWLFLLIPLALLRVISAEHKPQWLLTWKYLAAGLLILCLVPFVARQIQAAIYPQLEKPGIPYKARDYYFPWGAVQASGKASMASRAARRQAEMAAESRLAVPQPPALINDAYGSAGMESATVKSLGRQAQSARNRSKFDTSNLQYDPQVKIQTGPAKPEWSWNRVHCLWNGPVTAAQKIQPVLISLRMHRLLTALRIALQMLLAAILLGTSGRHGHRTKRTVTTAVMFILGLLPGQVLAQLPDPQMLDTLRERLLEPDDAYPRAAEIPSVKLNVGADRLVLEAEIHTALEVAVPLPGRLPTWTPVSVHMDGQPDPVVRRWNDTLWVNVPAGVHQVVVECLLPTTSDWEWTYLLKPRHVQIEAPQWNVTGVRPGGIVEPQVFFARKQNTAPGQAAYGRKDFQALVGVNRHLEIGHTWQVRTEVNRLHPPDRTEPQGKAVALNIPLLPGERVLTSNVVVQNGQIEVRIGAEQGGFSWHSELPVGGELCLAAAKTDRWVERWHLTTSPVWNASLSGLKPIYEGRQQSLIPVWSPWPGEEVTLSFSKPQAVTGDTVTVQQVRHETVLGDRGRTASLKLDLQCSLGGDFKVDLEPDADISSLQQDGRMIPVRRDGSSLILPVHPGKQSVEVAWRTSTPLETVAGAGSIVLPVAGANVTSVVRVPESRWILWADGPQRGPAVRFWTIVAISLLAAGVLGSFSWSPLKRWEWALLSLGLTQVHVAAAMLVVAWLFLLAWRGQQLPGSRSWVRFNLMQVFLVFLTMLALGVLVVVVGEGLLGNPEMFIRGNHSTRTALQWFQPRGAPELPAVRVVSISVWFYRLLMLCWALWLATALLRWLGWGWNQLRSGGSWMRRADKKSTGSPAANATS